MLDLPNSTELTPTEEAIAKGHVEALRQALREHPEGVSRMLHPPYKHAIRALEARCDWKQAGVAEDRALANLFEAIHPYASDKQNSPKELRLALELASNRSYHYSMGWLLDRGATLTNATGSELLKMVWADPDRGLDLERVDRWRGGQSFMRQHWEHQLLCVMALAGAQIDTMEAFRARMHSPLDTKRLANAFGVAMIGVQVHHMMQKSGKQLCATPQSLAWLSTHLGRKGLAGLLDQLEHKDVLPSVAYLRAQLDAGHLDQVAPRQDPPKRGGMRL